MRNGYGLAPGKARHTVFMAVFMLMSVLTGCAVTPGDQIAAPGTACATQGGQTWPGNHFYDNLVVADDHGRPAYIEDDFAGRIQRLLEQAARENRQLLIYVHGGLNTEKSIVGDKALGEVFRAMRRDGYEPLFLVWRTGGLETWWEQISRVRGAYRYERIIWDTPVYIANDLVQGVARAPVTYLKQMGRVADYYIASPEHGWKLGNEYGKYSGTKVDIDSNLIVHRYVDDEHPDFARQVGYTATFPARFVSSPFIDSLGTTAWENMMRRARTTIHQTAEFDPACVVPESELWNSLRDEPRGTGAFARLFVTIEKWQEARREAKLSEPQITLIGHSMGTIILGDLIRLFPDLHYRDIVYMGAATSIGEFARSVIPYLRRNEQARFYNLMLHPRLEAMELTAGGAVPSGSLLEWIDEMYEPPRTMLDRTLGKWRNVRPARAIIPKEVAGRIVLKVFGQGDGEPQAHGDFNDARQCFWNPGFWVVPRFSSGSDAWPAFSWSDWGRAVPPPIDQCHNRFDPEFMSTRKPT